jgi:MFS family permease
VPREVFPRAVTIASTNQALAFTSGPAVGGLLIAAAGIGAVYATYAVLICGSLAALAFVRATRPEGPRGAPSLRAIREGLSFVRRRPVVLGCMVLDMFAVIFGGAAALLPIYAQEILRVGPRGYGLLSSSLEIGAIATSVVLMTRPPVRRTGRTLLLAVGAYGVATIVFGLSRWFPLSVAAYMLVGAADQVSVVMRSTTIQLATPDELRGRVSSMNLLFIGASNQLGAAESGFVAALTSAPSRRRRGIACLLVLATVALTNPRCARTGSSGRDGSGAGSVNGVARPGARLVAGARERLVGGVDRQGTRTASSMPSCAVHAAPRRRRRAAGTAAPAGPRSDVEHDLGRLGAAGDQAQDEHGEGADVVGRLTARAPGARPAAPRDGRRPYSRAPPDPDRIANRPRPA